MNTEKFQAMVNDFANLIADYNACKSPVAKLALEKSIIVFAKNIARIDNCAIVEKKSEMACNCKHEKKFESCPICNGKIHSSAAITYCEYCGSVFKTLNNRKVD